MNATPTTSRLERFFFFKVELWLVLLLAVLAIIGSVLFGWIVRKTTALPDDAGRVGRLAVGIATLPDYALTLLKTGVELDAEGNLVQRNPQSIAFDSFSGLEIEDPSFDEQGLLLVSSYSEVHGISTVYLLDLATRERLWEWVPDHDQIVAMTPSLKRIADEGGRLPRFNDRASFRSQHPLLLEDGSIVISSGEGVLVRIDVHGNVLWTSDRHYHHSIERMADGNLIVPVVVRTIGDMDADGLRDDGYAIIDPDGRFIEERSIVDILKRSGYQGLIYGVGPWDGDRIHLNDVQPILDSDGFVQEGDIVFSARNLSTVFLYRPGEDRVVWLQTGPWANQHDVDYVGNGRFTVFGNDFVRGRGWTDYGNSNVYVYDMASGTTTRPYEDVFRRATLRTPTQGLQRLLDNGDVFVSLTDEHQLVRLSAERIRWRYVSPAAEGRIGALHWSQYYNRDEVDLSWLDELRTNGERVAPR